MPQPRPATLQVIFAVLVLAIGVFVYLLDRPSTSVYLVPDSWELGNSLPSVFGAIGDQLPTFAHTFAFTLLTSAALEPWRWSAVIACSGWWAIASLFEIAQSDAWAGVIAARVPGWFADWPLLDNVADYFVGGRFDWLDLMSIGAATLCAFAVIQLSHRGSNRADQ
jgi:hypothetical protein